MKVTIEVKGETKNEIREAVARVLSMLATDAQKPAFFDELIHVGEPDECYFCDETGDSVEWSDDDFEPMTPMEHAEERRAFIEEQQAEADREELRSILIEEYNAHDFEGLTPLSADEILTEIHCFIEFGEESPHVPKETSRETLERQRAWLRDFVKRWEAMESGE